MRRVEKSPTKNRRVARKKKGVRQVPRDLQISPWHAGTRPALQEKSEVVTKQKVGERASGSEHPAQET